LSFADGMELPDFLGERTAARDRTHPLVFILPRSIAGSRQPRLETHLRPSRADDRCPRFVIQTNATGLFNVGRCECLERLVKGCLEPAEHRDGKFESYRACHRQESASVQ
jgi:hypothetical protein